MTVGAPIAASNTVTYQPKTVPSPVEGSSDLTFGEVLSDLNPLQYLPVVGTIYRAITGDVIPKPLREAGSLVVSGLLGGPAGVAMNLAMLALEKLTGIDLEDVEQSVLAALNPAQGAAPASVSAKDPVATALPVPAASVATASSVAAPATQPASPLAAAQSGGWTNAQLAAYGVTKRADGNLQQGSLTGADVLNALQLQVIASANAA